MEISAIWFSCSNKNVQIRYGNKLFTYQLERLQDQRNNTQSSLAVDWSWKPSVHTHNVTWSCSGGPAKKTQSVKEVRSKNTTSQWQNSPKMRNSCVVGHFSFLPLLKQANHLPLLWWSNAYNLQPIYQQRNKENSQKALHFIHTACCFRKRPARSNNLPPRNQLANLRIPDSEDFSVCKLLWAHQPPNAAYWKWPTYLDTLQLQYLWKF